MLKKRLIFSLLYSDGFFVLSRNFRLQRVGNLEWLKNNYDFSRITYSIDELVVLDVSRGKKNIDEFSLVLQKLASGCFAPVSAGGGVDDLEIARKLFRSGADKIIVNSSLFRSDEIICDLSREFGQQSIIASMDIKLMADGDYKVLANCGSEVVEGGAKDLVRHVADKDIGELYLNSIDRDGTGQGYDMGLLDLLPKNNLKPVILSGGVGNSDHFAQGLADSRVDAVSTAHLFNFVGDGLKQARSSLVSRGFNLPLWNDDLTESFLVPRVAKDAV
jgi:cyclase